MSTGGTDEWVCLCLLTLQSDNHETLLSDTVHLLHFASETLPQMFEEPLRDLAADDGLKPRSV